MTSRTCKFLALTTLSMGLIIGSKGKAASGQQI